MKILPIQIIKLEFMKIVLMHIFMQHMDEPANKQAKEKIKSRCLNLIMKIDNKMEEE